MPENTQPAREPRPDLGRVQGTEPIGAWRKWRKTSGIDQFKPWQIVLMGLGAVLWTAVIGFAFVANNRTFQEQRERRQLTVNQPAPAPADQKHTAPPQQVPQDPASTYIERVQTYWLPQVQALPDAAPSGGEAYGQLLTQLDALRSYVADGGRLSFNTAQRQIFREFSSALVAKQRSLLPSFRRNYAEMLRAQLFRRDILVSISGPRADTLHFTGPLFSSNANIEDMQTELQPVLARLRFRRVEYRWSRYLNDGFHYDLQPPADTALSRD